MSYFVDRLSFALAHVEPVGTIEDNAVHRADVSISVHHPFGTSTDFGLSSPTYKRHHSG